MLRYLNHVADRFELRPYIQLNTRVTAAVWEAGAAEWTVTIDDGATVTARFFLSAVGCLSAYQVPSLPGLSTFAGPWYHSSRWPSEGVDFTGKRVGLIGTGSTGIQIAPEIAAVAEHLTVFQRTANFAVPNKNSPIDQDAERSLKAGYRDYRAKARRSMLGVPIKGTGRPALAEPPAELRHTYMERWEAGGGMPLLGAYTDLMVSRDANDTIAEFIRDRIRETVADPAAARDTWMDHVTEVAYSTLFPLADSWYIGANIPGKPRVYTPYVGGCGPYRDRCDAVATAGYEGFDL